LAPDAFSVAGPAGAYEFHALTLSLGISDAHAFTPSADAGKVTLVLAGEGGEDVSTETLNGVVTRLDRDNVVPLTDVVTVIRAHRVLFDVTATLTIPRGPDPNVLVTKAKQAIKDYAKAQYRIGAEVFTSGLIAAAKVVVARPRTGRDDLAFLWLLLGGVRNDDAAVCLLLGFDTTHDNAIVEWTEMHSMLLSC
jgi:phage-related baseplate assembly protein